MHCHWLGGTARRRPPSSAARPAACPPLLPPFPLPSAVFVVGILLSIVVGFGLGANVSIKLPPIRGGGCSVCRDRSWRAPSARGC